MHSIARFICLSLASICFFVGAPQIVAAFDEPIKSISTGDITGVYYATGSAVAKMHNIKIEEYELRLIAEASAGSVANIDRVIYGLSDFGVAQANTLNYARNGEEYWQEASLDTLRSVLGLYTEAFTIIAAVDAGINSLADLKGKSINIGEFGSADNMQAMEIINFLGLDPENDLILSQKPTYEASELLQAGELDAFFYTVGHPNLSVKEASHGDRQIMIVGPGQAFIDSITSQKEHLFDTTISVDYYTEITNKKPVRTIGVKAVLFCKADTDADVVYNVVKEVFENLDLFKRQYPAFANLTPKKISTGLIVPLHPGALRYFKEVGLLP